MSTGKVYVERALTGSDAPFQGTEFVSKPVFIRDGRDAKLNMDEHGVKFGRHTLIEHIDFYDESDIIHKYYEEVSTQCTIVLAAVPPFPSKAII